MLPIVTPTRTHTHTKETRAQAYAHASKHKHKHTPTTKNQTTQTRQHTQPRSTQQHDYASIWNELRWPGAPPPLHTTWNENVTDALTQAIATYQGGDEILLITGSLFIVAEALDWLVEQGH